MIDDARSGHQGSVLPAEELHGPAERSVSTPLDVQDAGRVLRRLVADHFDFIWRSLRRLGLSAADADDGAQRVFLVAAKKLERIDPGRERAFLFGTAQRVAMEARRAHARRPPLSDEADDVLDGAPDPEEWARRREARALLDGVLDELPMEARVPFVLFELEEMTVPDIAALLEVPAGTVASRLRRARELFRAAARRIQAREQFDGGAR